MYNRMYGSSHTILLVFIVVVRDKGCAYPKPIAELDYEPVPDTVTETIEETVLVPHFDV